MWKGALHQAGVVAVLALTLVACGGGDDGGNGPEKTDDQTTESGKTEPRIPQAKRATGRHILIGYRETPLGELAPRTRAEAETLAKRLMDMIRDGEDMIGLVQEFSDDVNKAVDKGIRRIRNHGVPEDADIKDTPRGKLPAYADVLFRLAPGDVGIVAPKDEKDLGFFVIKRIE